MAAKCKSEDGLNPARIRCRYPVRRPCAAALRRSCLFIAALSERNRVVWILSPILPTGLRLVERVVGGRSIAAGKFEADAELLFFVVLVRVEIERDAFAFPDFRVVADVIEQPCGG